MNRRGINQHATTAAAALSIGLAGAIAFAGCASPGSTANALGQDSWIDRPAQPSPGCTDDDGDGLGPGCRGGMDCDDSNALVRDECYACNGNQAGCPCRDEGRTIACGELVPDFNGGSGCRLGQRVCENGMWSECRAVSTALETYGLGADPTGCQSNPCDPYCQHYSDQPDESLTNLGSGIAASEAGIAIAPVEIDPGPSHACVNETAEAQPVPVEVYIMLDKSGSMNGTRWNAVVSALKAFVNDASSAGITVALDYFPESSSCDSSQYAAPSVDWTELPGGTAAIVASLDAEVPDGSNTPTLPALQGAIAAAQARQAAYPDRKVIVVLATDGSPNGCSSTVAGVADAAYAGLTGTPPMRTYVVGVGSVSNLNQIAAAGGTTSAYITDSGDASSFLAAMQSIRNKAVGCEYRLPLPSTGNLDPAATSVSYRYGTGAATSLDRFDSEAACGTAPGYYYDNSSAPTKLTLCPTTCATVSADINYKVDLGFQCKTSCGSAYVTPLPAGMSATTSGPADSSSTSASAAGAEPSVREFPLGCQYAIPAASVEHAVADPARLTVRYTPGGTAAPVDLPQRSGASACGTEPGYYYDNLQQPTIVTLCPATCAAVAGDPDAKIAIFYDCLPTHEQGVFTRDYAAVGVCPPGFSHLWSSFAWDADTPPGTSIDFTVAVADTEAGLASAPEQPLQFTDPPNTGMLVGRPIGAKNADGLSTESGWAKVDTTLSTTGLDRKAPYLRMRAILHGDPPAYTTTPVLKAWDLSVSCEASE